MDPRQNPTNDLLNILSKAMDANMYGSVEVYLEDGQITQITQRIIKKIKRIKPAVKTTKKPNHSGPGKEKEITLKFQN
ncbi:hypothetical protein HYW44_01770 [Candidatus Daviesbacteria bacterium]|nr:hypothetical protein [Candidatus Daviesbacteria bacterium]